MRRNIRDRVAALAPFLTFDDDPYIVVGDDGRLSWMMDGFTTSEQLSVRAALPARTRRASTTCATASRRSIDAYDGTTTFYVFDAEDPIIAAYRGVFPSAVQGRVGDAGRICASTCAIPELLLQLQAAVYGLYHMTDPEVFYNREDLWTRGHRGRHRRQRAAGGAGDGAELRADDAARRDRRPSSSRSCRSRRRTATT